MVNVELKIVSNSNRTGKNFPYSKIIRFLQFNPIIHSRSPEEHLIVKQNLPGFLPLLITSQILGLLASVILLYWIFAYAGGLALVSSTVIQWHAILLSISLVYLTGTGKIVTSAAKFLPLMLQSRFSGILVFRFFRYNSNKTNKLIHAAIKGISSVLAIVAIWVTFQNRFAHNKSNLYSMHSWIGLLTFVVYLTQVTKSFVSIIFFTKTCDNNSPYISGYHRITDLPISGILAN